MILPTIRLTWRHIAIIQVTGSGNQRYKWRTITNLFTDPYNYPTKQAESSQRMMALNFFTFRESSPNILSSLDELINWLLVVTPMGEPKGRDEEEKLMFLTHSDICTYFRFHASARLPSDTNFPRISHTLHASIRELQIHLKMG